MSIKINKSYIEPSDFIKDCPAYEYEPTYLPPVRRIIAMGDIHGDIELAIDCFKLASLIDDDYNWIADPPDTIVVQVGDQIDSCRPTSPYLNDCQQKKSNVIGSDMAVLEFFDYIGRKAIIYGGSVISLLGNHELMNVEGNFSYVSKNDYTNFDYFDKTTQTQHQGKSGRENVFKPGGIVSSKMACTRKSIIVIGSTMFAHAGVLPSLVERLEYLNLTDKNKLEYLNSVVRKWLLGKITKNKIISTVVDDIKLSPFWTRVYGSVGLPGNSEQSSDAACKNLGTVLKIFKIGKLVIGHTPQLPKINGTCFNKTDNENTLYRIDGAFSKTFGYHKRKPQVLEILDDKIFNIIS
jgi:hypothetical protein